MSLITDALKKANTQSLNSPSPRSSRPIWLYLVVGFSGFAVIVVARSLSRPPGTSPSTPSPSENLATSPHRPLGLNLLRAAESQWQLNGIVRGGEGKSLALINGQIVEEGQPLQGAKVIRVASDEVDLEADGKIRTLKLR